MAEVSVSMSYFSLIGWVVLHFPMLWEIDGKSYEFPVGQSNTMEWESGGIKASIPKAKSGY